MKPLCLMLSPRSHCLLRVSEAESRHVFMNSHWTSDGKKPCGLCWLSVLLLTTSPQYIRMQHLFLLLLFLLCFFGGGWWFLGGLAVCFVSFFLFLRLQRYPKVAILFGLERSGKSWGCLPSLLNGHRSKSCCPNYLNAKLFPTVLTGG